jgi:type I restriction enzyme, S subunit
MLKKINLKNLDKSKWNIFKFDKIIKRISEQVLPDLAKVNIYIGLEHIDKEDIHVRRQGIPSEVKGSKLRFYPGDIIFGKRRAYQRKAVIVNFDGICSAHAFVFRANKEIINPNLLPFFLHSDNFMDKMIDISVGGLSPTINWSDLKGLEFLLPPKKDQDEFVKLFMAIDDVIEDEKRVYDALLIYKECFINDFQKENRVKVKLNDLFEINWGDTNTTKNSYTKSGYIAYSAAGPDGYLDKYDFDTDGIVLTAIGTCGKCYLAKGKWSAIKNTITLIPKKIDHEYMKIIFEIIDNQSYWIMNGGVQKFISLETAKKSTVPSLDKNIITSTYRTLKSINDGLYNLNSSILASKNLQKYLINKIFNYEI